MGAVRKSTLTGIRLASALLIVIVVAAGLMVPSRASAANTFSAGDPVVANDEVNVRTAAGTSASIRAVAQPGQRFTIGQIKPKKANGLTWYRVSNETRVNYGWIASDFLTLDLPFEEGDCATVFDGSLNLRSKAGTSNSIVTVLADGTGVKVLANAPVKANGFLWYRVTAAGSTGWAVSQFLQSQNCGSTDTPLIEVGSAVRVFDGPLNMREAPDMSADIVQVLRTGASGRVSDGPVTADGFVWFEIRTLVLGSGWVAGDFIVADDSIDPDEVPNDETELSQGDSFIVTTDALNVRETAGLGGDIIDVVANGAVGTRVAGTLQTVDGFDWIRVNIPGVGTGWVVVDFLEET